MELTRASNAFATNAGRPRWVGRDTSFGIAKALQYTWFSMVQGLTPAGHRDLSHVWRALHCHNRVRQDAWPESREIAKIAETASGPLALS